VWSADNARAVTGPLWAATFSPMDHVNVPFVPTPMTCFNDCRKSNIRTRPFEVPIAMTPEDYINSNTREENTAIAVGVPNFLLPTSLNACPSILFNLVHRTTSHGTCGESLGVMSVISAMLLEILEILECNELGEGDP
jgi:hypothetical protein